MSMPPTNEQRYLKLLLDPLQECANYKPKFGTNDEDGISLEQFTNMYGADPFYHWIGLDSPLMYAAHKAAGGMTSIYRQIGTGCENLFRAIVQDSLGLSDDQVQWSYEVEKKDKTKATRTLDARIDLTHVGAETENGKRVREWLNGCGQKLVLSDERVQQIRGAVFEVRQGYKSADSKRQNADLEFGKNADAQNYLPVFAIISTQVSDNVIRRYKNAKMLVLTGTSTGIDVDSTYEFCKNVVGFELGKFFERNSSEMREQCTKILEQLLKAS